MCSWATHLHLQLAPFDGEAVHQYKVCEDEDEVNVDSDEEYESFPASEIHPTHQASSISAVSAVATLDPHQQDDQHSMSTLLSWTCALQLDQQPELSQQPELGQQPELSQQPELGQQPELTQQPQLGQLPGVAEPMKQVPPPANTDLLQIDLREVLGQGGTGIIYAGEWALWYLRHLSADQLLLLQHTAISSNMVVYYCHIRSSCITVKYHWCAKSGQPPCIVRYNS